MLRNNFEVDILVNGNKVKEYYHDGKVYVEAKPGSRYSIKIKNNSYRRILAVPTVDGLSVLDGQHGSSKSRGYIINGYDSMTIDGWRRSDKEVAEFFFSDKNDAYAVKVGKSGNEGVIGVKIFYEKEKIIEKEEVIKYIPTYPRRRRIWPRNPWDWWYDDDWYERWNEPWCGKTTLTYDLKSTGTENDGSVVYKGKSPGFTAEASMKAMACSQQPMEQKVGTGWGEDKKSEVTAISFERESSPSATFEVYYNTREELEKDGVNMAKPPVYTSPHAFPGDFCKPPQN